MRQVFSKFSLIMLAVFLIQTLTFSRESYEDYLDRRYERVYPKKNTTRDKPLSEIRPGEREELLDDLRNAVRDEIDDSLSKERKAKKKNINKNDIVNQVRAIVKEEIEDAIKLKQSRYLRRHTIELGGFVSYQVKGVESDENDNNNILKLYPQFSYFLGSNIALTMKGEAELNLTTDTQAYSGGIGPQFVFGITKRDEICFYAEMMGGISRNSALNDKIGYRYSNGMGLKFVMNSGVILNLGVQLVFDNLGDNVTGFQNIVVPTLGITAWF